MADIKIKDVVNYLEAWAPPSYQEEYDNSGLITGDMNAPVTGIMVTLDCIEAVIQEAIESQCNLVIAHHPIIFRGLKKLTGGSYIERTIIKAVKNNIAIYAIHTNLDNIATGVNSEIARRIGLHNVKILSPRKTSLSKLTTFVPIDSSDGVLQVLYATGAGQIGNYKDCSFQLQGIGTFTPTGMAQPHLGQLNQPERVSEVRIEVVFNTHDEKALIAALKKHHPYEEVAYYITPLLNENHEVGSGVIGELNNAIEPIEFLRRLKSSMNLKTIRHTQLLNNLVKRVAICGGSGSFLLSKAIQASADVFISADFKYHEFFDADNRIIIADIGHYESEVFTKDLIQRVLMEKFPSFAINFSKTVTNPISYL